VPGDEGLLRQALLNLVRNAAEACATATAGGEVLLKGELVRAEDGGSQRIQILDNGSGIENDALSKLFRPFYTTKGGRHRPGLGCSAENHRPAWRAGRSAQSPRRGCCLYSYATGVRGRARSGRIEEDEHADLVAVGVFFAPGRPLYDWANLAKWLCASQLGFGGAHIYCTSDFGISTGPIPAVNGRRCGRCCAQGS